MIDYDFKDKFGNSIPYHPLFPPMVLPNSITVPAGESYTIYRTGLVTIYPWWAPSFLRKRLPRFIWTRIPTKTEKRFYLLGGENAT